MKNHHRTGRSARFPLPAALTLPPNGVSMPAVPALRKVSTTPVVRTKPVAQLRGNRIPPKAQLEAQAAKGKVTKLISSTQTYEDILDAVENYYDPGNTPDTNYGLQLFRIHQISDAVTAWINKYGATTLPEERTLGVETTLSKRRKAVHSVSTEIPSENTQVKTQGSVQANAAHDRDRRSLANYVYEGATGDDRRLKNSCEWILRGKVPLFGVTETGDAYMRTFSQGKDPAAETAYFPKGLPGAPGDMMKGLVYYDKDNYADPNVTFDGRNVGGWNIAGGVITIVNPAGKPKESVWSTIRHEVQHDADKNRGRDAQQGFRQGAEAFHAKGGTVAGPNSGQASLELRKAGAAKDLQRYKTEYRAYSYQEGSGGGPYSLLDNSLVSESFGEKNFTKRQLAIFRHIYAGYEHTKSNWDADSDLPDGTKFRDAVAAYRDPDTEGFNKYNSPRVDDFYKALDAVGTKKPYTALETHLGIDLRPAVQVDSSKLPPSAKIPKEILDLREAASKLTEEDANYLLKEAPAMMAKMRRHMSEDFVDFILLELRSAQGSLNIKDLLKQLQDLNT